MSSIFKKQRLEEHEFQASLGYKGFYLRNRKEDEKVKKKKKKKK